MLLIVVSSFFCQAEWLRDNHDNPEIKFQAGYKGKMRERERETERQRDRETEKREFGFGPKN